MIIAMAISMSGGRDDDRPWPGIGVPFEVTDAEGKGLVRWGHAVDLAGRVNLDQVLPHLRLPGTPHVTAPAPVSLPSQTAAGPADNPLPVAAGPALVPETLPAVTEPETLPVVTEPETPPVVTEPDLAAGEPAEPPKPSDPKQDWIDYAVSGVPAADRIPAEVAGAMTKADLMSRFGGRL